MTEHEEIRRTSSPPPSYEQSLQHRRLEVTSSGIVNPACYQPPAPRSNNVPQRQHSERGESEASARMARILVPPMHIGVAGLILFFNCVVPGLGTLTASVSVFCFTKREEWTLTDKMHSSVMCLVIGMLQLLLTPLFLLGWIWSIFWGLGFVGVSKHDYHGIKDEDENSARPAGVVAPPAYSERITTSPDSPPPPYDGSSAVTTDEALRTSSAIASSTQETFICQSNHAHNTNVDSQETSAQVHSSARSHGNDGHGFRADQAKRTRNMISSAERRPSVISVISASSSSSRLHMFQENNVNSTLTDIA